LPWKKVDASTLQRDLAILLNDRSCAEKATEIARGLAREDGLRETVAAVTAIAD